MADADEIQADVDLGPHEATRRFERALAKYTGAPYAVAVSSCTAAIELCLMYFKDDVLFNLNPRVISIPKRTYVGVAQAIVRQGFRLKFTDQQWSGDYQLRPLHIRDCAKRLTSNMFAGYGYGGYQCVSFHTAKILGDSQGGAVLHENPKFDYWARKARFDGRTEGVPLCEDSEIELGLHCYMSSDVANRLHARLTCHSFPQRNPDQCPEGFLEREYSDLSKLHCFKPYV